MSLTNILAVDDDECNLDIIQEYLENHSIIVEKVNSSMKAWDLLNKNPNQFQVVLLDRMMPNMNGIELLKRIKKDEKLSHIPIILQTAVTNAAEMLEGIKEGAFYYLCKPYQQNILSRVIHSAEEEYWIRLMEKEKKINENANFIKRFCLDISNLEEVSEISAEIAKIFPEPDRVIFGISELIINAIEHGNLEIGFDEKEELVISGAWNNEVANRQQLPQNVLKRVRIFIDETESEITISIKDEGKGFDWQKFLFMDENRIARVNGRGICLSNLSFDSMTYEGNGNTVICKVIKK